MDTKEDLGTKSDKKYFIFFLSPTSFNTEGILILTQPPSSTCSDNKVLWHHGRGSGPAPARDENEVMTCWEAVFATIRETQSINQT